MRNVLIIKLRYIGDVLLATPMLQALKAAASTARLTVVVNRGTEEVLLGNPHVDDVLPLERGSIAAQWRFVSGLRRRGFDTVIDLTDADRSAFLTWMSGAPVRIGFNDERRARGWCYTAVVQGTPALHRIERDLAALKPLGVSPGDRMPRIWLAADDDAQADSLLDRLGIRRDRPIIVLQPGARYWFKAWPSERFSELADRLAEQYDCRILIGGTQQESGLAQQIVQTAKTRPVSLAGLAGVRTFAALLKRSVLFVGNDSGAMHIAAAVGTPIVALFGPSNPAEWGPRGGPAEVIYKGVDCRACFHPTCFRGAMNCMRQISVDEVYGMAMRLIRGA